MCYVCYPCFSIRRWCGLCNLYVFRCRYLYFVIQNTFYHRMCSVLAGVDHNELVSLADKHFSNISLTHEYEIPAFKRCRFTGSEVKTWCFMDLLSIWRPSQMVMIINWCRKCTAFCIWWFGFIYKQWIIGWNQLHWLLSNIGQTHRKFISSEFE